MWTYVFQFLQRLGSMLSHVGGSGQGTPTSRFGVLLRALMTASSFRMKLLISSLIIISSLIFAISATWRMKCQSALDFLTTGNFPLVMDQELFRSQRNSSLSTNSPTGLENWTVCSPLIGLGVVYWTIVSAIQNPYQEIGSSPPDSSRYQSPKRDPGLSAPSHFPINGSNKESVDGWRRESTGPYWPER